MTALPDRRLVPPVSSAPGGESAGRGPQALVRQALLATRRNELLTPVQAILDVAERILDDPKAREEPRFFDDVKRLNGAAGELRGLIEGVLTPDRLDAARAAGDWQAVKSRIRHDMLNRLNPVINYSEMWLEEAGDFQLGAFVPDLELLCGMGKRCFALIDTIMDSWDIESTVTADVVAPELKRLEDMVSRVTREQVDRPVEPGRLLIVDDNEINRDILRRLLESQGHVVFEAADGRQALDFLAREPCDLVLLDVVMPEMDGFEVLVRLKSDSKFREISVIMISALNEINYVVSCIKLGAEDYLNRPFNAVFLKARIGACLEKRRWREREIEYLKAIEVERLRADELLHVILPREVVAELKRSNAFIPRRYEGVAVLFADIVDFTPYCDLHPPEDVVQQLQLLVELWEETALKYGIQKIKTIGDAFMAACGLLSPVDNPVLNCVRCGLEMVAATQARPTGWNLRVGIHYGPVIGGVLGRRQYLFDLFGDTVNTAARMESHGVKGRIVLSSNAWAQVEKIARGTQLDPAPVKGKGIMLRFQFDEFQD
ncbi:MAG: response regulator [Planctomycetia bacterium]|nr:response regulator [Planctomycetia bacterium]